MSGYVSPRGMFYPANQPYLAYEPGHAVRFFRSQYSWPGTPEIEDQYKGSQQWSGWSAARPFPNRVPFLETNVRYGNAPPVAYNLPDGPTQPKQLLQQLTVPPTFPTGDWRIYDPMRYAVPQGDGAPGSGGAGGGLSADAMARAMAAGLKLAMPELATSIGIQTARANAAQIHTKPANVDPPIRKFEFTDCNSTPVSVSDGTFVLITEHRVPRGCVAVANQLEVRAESAAALEDTEVQIRVGGLPVPRYDSIDCPSFGTDGPAAINVTAIEDELIQVFARARTVAATHNVVAMIRGWDTTPSFMTRLDALPAWRGQ